MTGLEITLAIFLLLSLCVVAVCFFYIYRFGIIILKIEDAIEQSLDILDQRYASITEVLSIPLFADSPEIRQVHKDIEKSRDAILTIANALTNDIITDEEME